MALVQDRSRQVMPRRRKPGSGAPEAETSEFADHLQLKHTVLNETHAKRYALTFKPATQRASRRRSPRALTRQLSSRSLQSASTRAPVYTNLLAWQVQNAEARQASLATRSSIPYCFLCTICTSLYIGTSNDAPLKQNMNNRQYYEGRAESDGEPQVRELDVVDVGRERHDAGQCRVE